MKFKKIINEILCLAMAITMFSSGVVKVQAENVNLALNKDVTASHEYPTMPATMAVDGNLDTRWASEGDGLYVGSLTVNLGEPTEFNQFKIYFEKGGTTTVTDYKIEGSNNPDSDFVELYNAPENLQVQNDYEEVNLETSQTYQYVKITVNVSGYSSVSLREFEIYNVEGESTTPVNTNLALNKTVAASAEYSTMPAKNLTDSDLESRWSSEAVPPQHAVVDLGESYDMNYFSIIWESDSVYASAYKIYVSEDPNNFGEPVVTRTDNTTKLSEEKLETAVTGRYVKLEVTGMHGYQSVSARDFKVMLKDDSQQIPQDPEDNVALNKTGYSSSNETEGLNANKAFDGDTSTRDSRWSSKVGNAPHWVFVDLGETKDVKTIRIYWETRKATEYRIQVADTVTDTTTGEGNWKDVATFTEHPSSTTDTITLANIEKARYVRLYIDSFTSEDPDGSGSWNSISIYEMEVYGGTPAISMGDIGNMIKVETPMKDSEKLNVTLPEVEGYTVTYNGTDLEQVIDENLTIYTPVVDKTVKVSFKIVNNETKEYQFKEIEVTVPGQYSVAVNDNAAPEVLPELQEWKGNEGSFTVTDSSKIVYADDDLKSAVDEMKADYEDLTGKTIEVVKGTKTDVKAGDFFFEKTTDVSLGLMDEGYLMEIDDFITVTSETQTGAYWATRTLLQALKQSDYVSIPKGIARDYPLYEVRGFILDVGRKTFTMDYLEQLVKQMSWYKMNDFQVHLNDNLIGLENKEDPMSAYSAFRLENDTVKAGGKLTDANGNVVTVNGNEQVYQQDLTSTDLWYTKEEFKNFIEESRELGVNIVPEIDTPAHSLALTKVLPDLRYGTSGRQNDHLDLVDSYEQCLTFVQTIFNEYLSGTNPVFDSETIVHIGADEYNASSEAYRKFVNDMIEYVRDTKERKVRVWGSFTQCADGEVIDTVADDGTRVQINLWNFGYANMDEMYENGFDLINCNDGNYYIVPNAGYYYDYLSDGTMYNLDINSIGGVTIPAGDKQMIGGAFAVWNDMTDYLDNGISEWDVYDRINNLPLFAAKLWGKEELNLNDANARADKLGDAPRTNFNYEVDSETDEYMNLPMDELEDTSSNEVNVSSGENASIVEVDGKNALELKGSTSYVMTDLETAGLDNSLRVKVKRTSTSTEEQILFESPYGSIKAVQKETGKVGFSRERFDYSFNYTLPLNEWVELEFKNVKNRISLYVNGELVDTIGDGEKVEGRPLLATMMFPMATIGSKTNAFIGYVDDVRIGKDTTFTSTMSLDYALWNATTILNDDNRNLLEPLIKEGKALLTQYAPEENEITRLSNEINKIVEAQDFEKADYTRVDIYKSLVEDLSAFTEESAKAVTRILDSIRYSLPVELQDTVDGYEYDLLKAIEGLETKPLTNLYYVDQSTMTATASSYQKDGSKPSNVLDGNPSTMWHTDWNITSMPHWIDLELSEPTEINGLVYTPRQSGTNGNATKYEIQVLVDGTYQTITSGTLKNDSTVKTIEFDPVTTTHIRLVYLEAANNNGSAAELQVVRANINADIEGLNTAIKDAEELLATLDKTDFTEATWTDVQNLLADAKALVSSSTPDANEVAQMIYDISKRVTQLRLEGNLTELNAAIDKAESLKESDYTATSWAFMQEKLAAAKEVAKNKNALQSTIDLAAAELNDAIDRLVKVDKTELQNKLNEAKSINTSEYTKESVAVLDKAMAEAEKVLTNANATQEEVDAAVKALEDAISGLQKPADPDTPTDPEKPTDPDTPADPEKPTDETPEEPETPTTSDNNMMVIYAGLLLLSAMVMVVLFKKRRQEH